MWDSTTDYGYLIDHFSEKKIVGRFDMLYEKMSQFIKREKLSTKVFVSEFILQNAVIDYFADVYRLKEFHTINHVNEDKITAYTAYWLLRRHPIQMKVEDRDPVFINEKFVLSYLQLYLSGKNFTTIPSHTAEESYQHFLENLYYTFIYRRYDAQVLETIILAVRYGQAFQKSVDFSNMEA